MPTIVQINTLNEGTAPIEDLPQSFLVSSGRGDLHLLTINSSTNTTSQPLAQPINPLRPRAPLQGIRTFQLLSAMQLSLTKEIVVILWAVRRGEGTIPAACEIYAMTLTHTSTHLPTSAEGDPSSTSPSSSGTLEVAEVQLLHRSSMPPHGALCNPANSGILIASAPVEEKDEDAAHKGGLRIVNSNTLTPAGIENLVLNSDGGRGGNAQGTTQGNTLIDDEDGDDISPRTLQAAVARLSQLTSEDLVADEDLPRNQYADVFKESGPDGVGAMGGEPLCTLLCYTKQRINGSTSISHQQSGELGEARGVADKGDQSPSAGGKLLKESIYFRCIERVLCHPHRLLGCQMFGDALRLSLTDDVDCAVVEITPILEESHSGTSTAHLADHIQIHQESSTSSPSTTSPCHSAGFSVKHAVSVPALAYVAAGKIQRKFVLAPPTGPDVKVAAVLIEARQYSYVYRSVDIGESYGQQAVVDMGLEAGAGVLGAALLGGSGGNESEQQQLLVLGTNKLLSYSL